MVAPCGNTVGDAAFASDDYACRTANGDYSFFIISGSPSPAQINKICGISACQEEIAAIRKAQPKECEVHNKLQLYRDILDPITVGCKGKNASASEAPSSSSQSPANSPTTTPSAMALRTAVPVASQIRSSQASNMGMMGGIGGGIVVVALLIGFFVFRSRRNGNNTTRCQRDSDRYEAVTVEAYNHHPKASTSASVPHHTGTNDTASSTDMSRPTPTSQFSAKGGYCGQRAVDPAGIPLLNDSDILRARIPYDAVEFTSFIDNGAYGSVHAGIYQGTAVAIKKLRASHASDVRAISKFMEEAKLMVSLTHAHIVSFIGVAWTKPENVCVVMEYMAGGDLLTLLQKFDKDPATPMGFDRRKLQIALDVAEALTYLHARWPIVIHRDLKSNNILLTAEGAAKVTDFGVSREHADDNMTMKVGTQRWMAPEVIQGEDYDEKADVFSFGVVLSEIDTNKIPYATHEISGMTPLAMMQSVARGQLTVEFSYSSDPRIVALGRECVSIDPRKRPSMDDARRRIQAILS